MNAVPMVAGVGEIVMTVPAPDEHIDQVLAAAEAAGVDKVVTVGGAQAVAALAYGTDSVPRVDDRWLGNIYVATAKRVFGAVGIDGGRTQRGLNYLRWPVDLTGWPWTSLRKPST